MPKADTIKVRLRVKSPGYWFEIHVLGLLQTQRHKTPADRAPASEFPSSSPAKSDNCHGTPPSTPPPLCLSREATVSPAPTYQGGGLGGLYSSELESREAVQSASKPGTGD